MLIRCPTCASDYDLDRDLLCEGLILRCACCRDAWVHATRDTPVVAAAPIGGPRPDRLDLVTQVHAVRRSTGGIPVPRRARRQAPWLWTVLKGAADAFRRRAAAVATMAILIVAVGGGMAAVAAKEQVVETFPPSASIFATLGLHVNIRGLALHDLRSKIETEAGATTLTLQCQIVNLRPDVSTVPSIRIAVRDSNQRELYYWTVPAPKPRLNAGERVEFRSRLSAPPRDGQDVVVSFADPPVSARNRVATLGAGGR